MSEQPTDYYARRADEERRAAEAAEDERAAQSHRELAAHYARVARGEEEPPADDPRSPDQPRITGGVSSEFRIVP